MSELYELIEIKQGIKDTTEDECAIDRIRIICMLEHILTVQYNEISINHKNIKNVYDYIPEYKTKYGNHISTLEREALGCVYGVFKIKSTVAWKMYVTDVKVETKAKPSDQREHIQVALKDVQKSCQNLKEDKILITSDESGDEEKEFTLLVWLHSHAGHEFTGAKISFNIVFEAA